MGAAGTCLQRVNIDSLAKGKHAVTGDLSPITCGKGYSRQLCFHYLLGALVKNPSNWLHLCESASQLRELDDHLLSAVNLVNLNSALFSYRVVPANG
jgi:hypothetical protein